MKYVSNCCTRMKKPQNVFINIGALILRCKRKIFFNISAEPPNFRNVSVNHTQPCHIIHNIPHGWRLASSSDVRRFPQQAQKEISTNTKDHTKMWLISTLSDGIIHGRGLTYKVDRLMCHSCPEKLLIKGTYILWRAQKAN